MAFWLVGLPAAIVLAGLLIAPVLARLPHRRLPAEVTRQLEAMPMDRYYQHLVDVVLADGRTVEGVRIAYSRYPAFVGGKTLRGRYRPHQVVSVRPSSPRR